MPITDHDDHGAMLATIAACPWCPPIDGAPSAPSGQHVCENLAKCWGDPDCPVYSSRPTPRRAAPDSATK